MIEENGQVVEVQGEFAWVEHERTSTCGSCSVRKGCGTSAIARVLGQRRVRLRVLNRINAAVGDQVVVGIAEQGLLRGSLAVYAMPLLGLFETPKPLPASISDAVLAKKKPAGQMQPAE